MAYFYDNFIELSPGYESVVDVGTEKRQVDFWKRYIVSDDMVNAVKVLTKSLRHESDDVVRHFWIRGAYGTGKTYSAIVIKHLLEDDYSIIENFLSKNKLFIDCKDKFLGVRKNGRYYVDFKSGQCKQLNTSNKFLMEVEKSVRNILRDNNFGYTGRNSLVDAVKNKTEIFKKTLEEDFNKEEYPEIWGIYGCFDEFYECVMIGDVDACLAAQEILQLKDIGLATDLETFKMWLKDVFDGNPKLAETGMFIIWDEFTEYIRHNDLDIIQQLSLIAKDMPFFIIYVMHEFPGLLASIEDKNMGKAEARFHKIDVSLTEKTAYKLIGESIITKDGMLNNWKDVCDQLYESIKGKAHEFMDDPGEDMDINDLKKTFPIHPMSVHLVSKVAGFAASNRSIFKFLKSDDGDGFKNFIHDNGPEDWKWVTPDYLWDYYFVKNSGGVKELTPDAEECLKHYRKVERLISDEKALRVFKGAMLLLSTVGSSHSLRKSSSNRGIRATLNTLADCFYGQLSKDIVSSYLNEFYDKLKIIVLAKDRNEDFRIELPYNSGGDDLDLEIKKHKEATPLSLLFDTSGTIGSFLKKQFMPEEKTIVKRIELETCWGTMQQINSKILKLSEIINKVKYKFGFLLIVVDGVDNLSKIKEQCNKILKEEDSKRLMICIITSPFDIEKSKDYFRLIATASLAQKSGNIGSANSSRNEASELCGEWISSAIGKELLLFTNVIPSGSMMYSNKNVISQIEKNILDFFPNAPETIIKKITLYKSGGGNAAYYGLTKVTLDNKKMTNDKQKNFNQQYQDVVDTLKDNAVWEIDTIDELKYANNTRVSEGIAKLCSFIDAQFALGTVVLSDLWEKMQAELGYYDTLGCHYLLGFVMRFYLGKFTWNDGTNSHRLNEETTATMINAMCSGKSAGMKVSSESDNEKRFKEISKRIFNLPGEDIGDNDHARKNIRLRISKIGYPFWTLKYLDNDKYAGIKEGVVEIVSKYQEYISETGSQQAVYEDSVSLIKLKAKEYVAILKECYTDKHTLAIGIKNFINTNYPETLDYCKKYNFTVSDLFNMLRDTLQEEVWQWKEQDVKDKLVLLTLDIRLVGKVNDVINGTAKSVEKLRNIFENKLNNIKVPGVVYKNLNCSYNEAINFICEISNNKWVGMGVDEKCGVLDTFENKLDDAIKNIENPRDVLKSYLETKGSKLSFDEVDEVLNRLNIDSFAQSENNFNANINKILFELEYLKMKNKVITLWQNKTATDDISYWCIKWMIPIYWVMPNKTDVFNILFLLKQGDRVDINNIEMVINSLSNDDYSVLSNVFEINKAFLSYVTSDKYETLLLPHIDEVKEKIRSIISRDVVIWHQKIVEIRILTEKYISSELKSEIINKAKQKLSKLSDAQLRTEITKLLDSSTEACLLMIEKD